MTSKNDNRVYGTEKQFKEYTSQFEGNFGWIDGQPVFTPAGREELKRCCKDMPYKIHLADLRCGYLPTRATSIVLDKEV